LQSTAKNRIFSGTKDNIFSGALQGAAKNHIFSGTLQNATKDPIS
jgi:hypothetical protein